MAMDTPNAGRPASREAILATLSNVFVGSSAALDGTVAAAFRGDTAAAELLNFDAQARANKQALAVSGSTTEKEYRTIVANSNCTSYSKLLELHRCPRAAELEMYQAARGAAMAELEDDDRAGNVHFAFGHAVGAGIQSYAVTKDLESSIFAAMVAWKIPYDAEHVDKRSKNATKSLPLALWAVEAFVNFYAQVLGDWEILILPNGKPAVELAFVVDFENGYYHFGHVDAVLVHRETKRLAVWEGKTLGSDVVDEAQYANSSQALGYSVIVDKLAELIGAPGSDYEVMYIVYSTISMSYKLLPFSKSRAQRAAWMQDILLDHASLAGYKKLNFYPPRGESCFSGFFKRCKWFGNCTMSNAALFPGVELPQLEGVDKIPDAVVDYRFSLSELVAAQKSKT